MGIFFIVTEIFYTVRHLIVNFLQKTVDKFFVTKFLLSHTEF